jgi:YhcH/YjgK/YiaL family protein
MILDVLENAHTYFALHEGFAGAFDFLARPGLKELPVGKYPLDGDRLFAIVALEHGRDKEDALLETHDKYIDIQCVLKGTDRMGWKPKTSCLQPSGEYDPQTDLRFYADEPDVWLAVKSGAFAIFYPEDAHLPLISTDMIHKVIVKVAVSA